MNRKDFLQHSILSALALTTMPRKNHQSSQGFHVIGIGTNGCQIAAAIGKANHKAQISMLDYHMPEWIEPQHLFVHSVELLSALHYNQSHSWLNNLQAHEMNLVIGGLGGYTGSTLCKKLIPYLANHGIRFQAILTYPFGWEGKRCNQMANDAREVIKNIKGIDLLYMDELTNDIKHRTITDALTIAQESIKDRCLQSMQA